MNASTDPAAHRKRQPQVAPKLFIDPAILSKAPILSDRIVLVILCQILKFIWGRPAPERSG